MARHDRLTVLTAMKKIGLVPIFHHPDLETAKKIICASADAGVNIIEFTNRSHNSIDLYKQLIEFIDKEKPEVIFGAGTICDGPTASMYIAAGADFILSPVLDDDIAKICNIRKVPYVPGCGTLNDIHRAHKLGVEICKMFPVASFGGPDFIKAIKAPCPWVEIMPMGGIVPEKECLAEWFDAGAVCIGMGSKLISKELLEAGDFTAISQNIKNAARIIKQVRK